MEAFTVMTAVAAPMLRDNIDTDIIIPSREMKTVSKTGLSAGLFAGWRYTAIGGREPNIEFVLNQPAYAGTRILLGGSNFGCGSSREHAVWALYDYGFRCVVSSFFADIFKNNCLNIGVLPVTISAEFADILFAAIAADPTTTVEINLPQQTITLLATGASESFDINEYKKDNMQHGFDDIDYLINMSAEIEGFEASR